MKSCSVPGCTKTTALVRGWCAPHYDRWRRHGDPLGGGPIRQPRGICSELNCGQSTYARGFCLLHYTRWKRHGDPQSDTTRSKRDPNAPCTVTGCSREPYAKGLCQLHWLRNRRGTELTKSIQQLCQTKTHAGAHQRLYTLWGRAADYPCITCGAQAKEWAYDGTDPTQGYGPSKGNGDGKAPCNWFSSWPEFYMPLCRPCHRARDGETAKLELQEYRAWKARHPGITLSDLDEFLNDRAQDALT